MKHRGWSTLLVVASLTIAACGDVRWVAISRASATDASATSVRLNLDVCDSEVPPPQVVESDTEVHVRIDRKHDYGGNEKACLTALIVHLTRPIGTRKVIDDRHDNVVPVTWMPITQPLQLAGSVSELLGREGNATVTAWLLVDQSGAAVLCDDLPADAQTCPTSSMPVDWAGGGATPPSDLIRRGATTVSSTPITLTGSLKGDTLHVGVTQ